MKLFGRILNIIIVVLIILSIFIWIIPLGGSGFSTIGSMAYKDVSKYKISTYNSNTDNFNQKADTYSAIFSPSDSINIDDVKIDTFVNGDLHNLYVGDYKLLPPILKSDSKKVSIDIEEDNKQHFIISAKLKYNGKTVDITDKFKLNGNDCVVYQTMQIFEYKNNYYALAVVQDVNKYDEDYVHADGQSRNTTSIKYFVLNLSKNSKPMIIKDSANNDKMFRNNKYTKALDQRGINYLYAYPVEDTVQIVFAGTDQIKNKELLNKIKSHRYQIDNDTFIYLSVNKKEFDKFMNLLEG